MAVESSDPCPCGSNKKIKFCCGQAIAPELEKIARSLEGEQFMAAIERLKTLIDQHGELPCLLALKGLALISSGQVQEAHANAGQFCELDPDNATAWAQRALTVGEDADADLALGYLQKSLELADPSQLAPITLPALQVVTDVLFQSGNAFGGFWHLSLQLAFQRNDQQSSLMQVLPFTQNRSIPLLLKQQLQIPDAPAECAWQQQYDEALVLAGRGAWMASREVILAIDADDPTLTQAIACLSTFLGDTQQGPAAWRRFGATCEPESDEAVEAEAYAQLLQNQVATDTVDLVTLTYAVTDVEQLQEQLVSSRQVRFVPDFQWPAADADNPPPRAAFILLDREMPDSGEQISIEQVPQAVATACLFGKQTDQEARIECTLVSAADTERDQPLVEQVLGELAAELQSRETSGQVGTAADALSWHPVWPEKTSSDTIQQFNVDQRNTALEEKWPELPLATFDGASARQMVENEGGRIKVMAAILLMETNMQAMDHLIDLDSLRQNLGLTAPGPIDPESIDIKGYPDIRFSRFLPNKMSMDQLTTVYSRGVFLGNSRAIILAAREITSREEKPENLNMAEVYGSLVETASSNSERIELLQKCRQAAHDQEQSPAIWLLREIPLQLAEGNGTRVSEIIQVIQAQHMQEPGIAEQLYSLLVQIGILNPDGTPATPTTAPAAGSDGIWTPDGSTSSSEQEEGGGKSSIWVPGMD